MEPTGDPVLTGWAADCADHVLAQFVDFADQPAQAAIAAARAWASGNGALDDCRQAAFAAQLSARDLAETGYQALTSCVRAASSAAASADDSALAETAADYAVEALLANSAPCEQSTAGMAERRWQWLRLAEEYRDQVFDSEPPEPGPASCTTNPPFTA